MGQRAHEYQDPGLEKEFQRGWIRLKAVCVHFKDSFMYRNILLYIEGIPEQIGKKKEQQERVYEAHVEMRLEIITDS